MWIRAGQREGHIMLLKQNNNYLEDLSGHKKTHELDHVKC